MGGSGQGGSDPNHMAAGSAGLGPVCDAVDVCLSAAVFPDRCEYFHVGSYRKGGTWCGQSGQYDGKYYGICSLPGPRDESGYPMCSGVWIGEKAVGGPTDAANGLLSLDNHRSDCLGLGLCRRDPRQNRTGNRGCAVGRCLSQDRCPRGSGICAF